MGEKRRIKLDVAYDGTNYHGWQIQPQAITVEGILNQKLSELLREDIKVIGASRTDAGVHAYGNVAVFDTTSRIPLSIPGFDLFLSGNCRITTGCFLKIY